MLVPFILFTFLLFFTSLLFTYGMIRECSHKARHATLEIPPLFWQAVDQSIKLASCG